MGCREVELGATKGLAQDGRTRLLVIVCRFLLLALAHAPTTAKQKFFRCVVCFESCVAVGRPENRTRVRYIAVAQSCRIYL